MKVDEFYDAANCLAIAKRDLRKAQEKVVEFDGMAIRSQMQLIGAAMGEGHNIESVEDIWKNAMTNGQMSMAYKIAQAMSIVSEDNSDRASWEMRAFACKS